ncbi:MAG: hypothetical protein M0Z53_09945 [Thermaerobacter sp.]|nr:hypothetical protein [Thermaerobacter sp.]
MNLAGFFIFLAAAGLLWSRNMIYAVWYLAAEGILLGVMVGASGPVTWLTGLVGIATLAIKAGLIPVALHRMMKTWPSEFRQDHPLPLWAYFVAILLVLAVGHVIHLLAPAGITLHPELFFYGLASIHLGLLMIVARRHVLSQVASLVGIENGLVVLAASVAGSLPTFVELGMLMDLTIAISLLVWMSHHIHRQFNTTDVAALRRLRG